MQKLRVFFVDGVDFNQINVLIGVFAKDLIGYRIGNLYFLKDRDRSGK